MAVRFRPRALKLEIDGPLAHLVERFHGMEEATGSNPVWSTKRNIVGIKNAERILT